MRSSPKQDQELDVVITALGTQGDGLARAGEIPVYVSHTAPGDQVRVKLARKRGAGWAASVIRVSARGNAYRDPPCPHYDHCGGCVLQHVTGDTYRDHKLGTIRTALSRSNVEAQNTLPPVWLQPGQRWRATLGFQQTQNGLILGFHERRGRHLAQIDQCLVLTENLSTLLAPLRTFLETLCDKNDRGSVVLLDSATGVDVTIQLDRDLSLATREAVTSFAHAHDLARLSWQSDGFLDVLLEQRPPQISLGGVLVPVPQGVFLQASAQSTQVLVDFVLTQTQGCSRVADLFCGIGTFAVPLLAAGKSITAYDSDKTALASLQGTVRKLSGSTDAVQWRDLFRHPLSAQDLGGFDAVVLDPPKQGAKAQIAELAGSTVKKIVYVSCNPGSFASDAAVLAAAGYVLQTLMPLDQFTYAADMELAAVLVRP